MKEKDKLEKFILQNREAFESELPPALEWSQIEGLGTINKPLRRMYWIRYVAAAAVVLLLGVAIGIMSYPTVYQYQQVQVLNDSEEFKGMETYFNREVSALLTKMENSTERRDLEEELRKIDSEIENLKVELVNAPKRSKEVILEAIIVSFEAKVELMETALNRTEEVKKIKDEIQHI